MSPSLLASDEAPVEGSGALHANPLFELRWGPLHSFLSRALHHLGQLPGFWSFKP